MTNRWTKQNIPTYQSVRVTVKPTYDDSNKRHLIHTMNIYIDGDLIISKNWYEDDDWVNNGDDVPNAKEMWEEWVKALPEQ